MVRHMKTTPPPRLRLTILAMLAVLAGHAMAAPAAELTARWAEQAFAAPSPGGPVAGIPFSFVYGGKPSAELLPQWSAAQKEEAVNATTRRRTLSFTDPQTGLEVKAVADIYLDTPGVDWTVYFTNTGTKDTPILEQVRAVDIRFAPPAGEQVTLHRLRGGHFEDKAWQPFEQVLTPGAPIGFGALSGWSSRDNSPFFTVSWGNGGVITAVGWSGQWRALLTPEAGGGVRIEAGMEFLHASLHPGESIRSPRILQVLWEGGDLDWGQNQFRRTMLAHIVPQRDGKPVFPPIAHTSCAFYESNATTEAIELGYLASFKDLGFEYHWLDAYWHRDGFPAGIGNYGFPLSRAEPPDRFPNGLAPLSRAVHDAGLGFLLWFEPERVAAGTAIAREHPEWVMKTDVPHSQLGDLFDMGNPEAREFMTRYLKAAVKEYALDILRFDYNIEALPFWQEANRKNPDRVGISEIRYVEGLYQMWDDLRAEFPKLVIDNCANGGSRVDLETASRSIALWRTDYTIEPLMKKDYDQAALQNQVMNAGLNRYLPFSLTGQMGADPYHFRSGFNGGITFGEDTRPADYPRELLKQAIAEGKRLRKYYLGDFYPLSDVHANKQGWPGISYLKATARFDITPDPRDWTVMQYDRPEDGDGVLLGFRRHHSPFSTFQCRVKGIDPESTYEVTRSLTYQPEPPVEMKGADLQRINLEILDMPGSVVLEYKKVPPSGK